jgi:hypothetical protein
MSDRDAHRDQAAAGASAASTCHVSQCAFQADLTKTSFIDVFLVLVQFKSFQRRSPRVGFPHIGKFFVSLTQLFRT